MCNYQSNLIFKPYFAQVSHLRTSSGQSHFTGRRGTTATKTYLDSRVFLATRTCSTIKAFLVAFQELNNQSITFPPKQVEHLSNIKN